MTAKAIKWAARVACLALFVIAMQRGEYMLAGLAMIASIEIRIRVEH